MCSRKVTIAFGEDDRSQCRWRFQFHYRGSRLLVPRGSLGSPNVSSRQ